MSNKDISCTLSGLRPYKLPEQMRPEELAKRMELEIRHSISEGYGLFLSGMAMGVDIWAAEIIVKLKREYDHIRLICYLPWEDQASQWNECWREPYFRILGLADDVLCLQSHYSAGCLQRRNMRMIDDSSRLIAVYDGRLQGGTAHTVAYARGKGLETIIIDPLSL